MQIFGNCCFHYQAISKNIILTDMIKIKIKINLTVDLHVCTINMNYMCV